MGHPVYIKTFFWRNLNTKMKSSKLFVIFFHEHVHFYAILPKGHLHHIIWDFFMSFHIFVRGVYVRHGSTWNFAGPHIYLQPAKVKSAFWGFAKIFGLESKVLRMKTECLSKFFISSVFTSDN